MKNFICIGVVAILFFVIGCKTDKKYHDTIEKRTKVAATEVLQGILDFQEQKNEEFKNPETSPLPDRYRKNFESLDFFAPDTSYVVQAKLIRTPEALPFQMPTTTNRKSTEVVYGVAHFVLDGKPQQLQIYQNKELMKKEGYEDYLFLPFADVTNDEETYGGGRYIDLSIPENDTIVIDFNRAYNPYCVYNKKYSCPLVPPINRLDVRVLAGVKAFKKEVE